MTFRPTITALHEQRRLEWVGHLVLPGIVDGRHSVELESSGGHRCRLTQTEVFTGLLVPLTTAMPAAHPSWVSA